jgi:hypothetical protein
VWAKGTLSTDANGSGFLCSDPTWGAANDQNTAFYSNGTAPTPTINLVPGGGVSGIMTNSDYVAAQIGPQSTAYKVVSHGIRIRYIGTELNRGGQIIGLSDPSHNSLTGRNFANFQAELVSRQFAVGRKWVNVLYKPVLTTDLDMQTVFNTFSNTNTDPSFFNGFFIQSAVPNQPFEFEIYSLFEFQGAGVRGQTRSHADSVGFAAIQSATLTSPTTLPHEADNSQHLEKSFLDEIVDVVGSEASTVFSSAAKAAGNWALEEGLEAAAGLLIGI